MNKVICFGELLLRLSPDADGSWISKNIMPVFLGGAELNVATSLANWKVPVAYCTALPDNAVTQHLRGYLRQTGIDESLINLSGERTGIYYIPQGGDLKGAGVIYDRAYSSFSQLRPGMIDWDKVFDGAQWFHFTAINPALNENVVAVCEEALAAAVKKGVTVSVDLNYRARLWKYGKTPLQVMPQLAEYCDIIMGNIWSANTLLGMPVDEHIHDKKSKQAYLDHASKTAAAIMQRFSKCSLVANTFRFDAGEGIHYFAALNNAGEQFVSPEFNSPKVLDKAGSGDCFMAGLLYGLYHNNALQDIVNFAAAATFGKLHEKGDTSSQTVQDVLSHLQKAQDAVL
ncbi:sugar kinase [Foetidibacter luteolus]|uniref:sugar kinase n=1 Tax=Foetidibacter luteolus TaxID=2608880 RepID=UPI00129A6CAD|nr:sugar kinase [Foetidibacter luteolus]